MVVAASVERVAQGSSHPNQAGVITPLEAETLLADLAAVFLSNSVQPASSIDAVSRDDPEEQLPNVDAIYRALAAQMFLSGTPLRSSYRVMARDGRVVWFHCEAKMIRRKNGRPWFIHGIAFDITELKQVEEELQQERNVVSAILHTVGSLVVVLDPQGRIVRFNRACEQVSGYSFAEVKEK